MGLCRITRFDSLVLVRLHREKKIRPNSARPSLLVFLMATALYIASCKNFGHCDDVFDKNNLRDPLLTEANSFVQLVEKEIFVDKSLFIEHYLKYSGDYKVSRIIRPTGWGKTTNLQMLKNFLEVEFDDKGRPLSEADRVNRKYFVGNRPLLDERFSDTNFKSNDTDVGRRQRNKSKRKRPVEQCRISRPLKIARYEDAMRHQGRYPVLYVDCKDICSYNSFGMRSKMKKIISVLFRRHKYLKKTLSQFNLQEFLNGCSGKYNDSLIGYHVRFLCGLLRRHFNETVYIFVEDYDAPVKSLYAAVFREYKREYVGMTDEELYAKVFGSDRFRKGYLFLWTFLEKLFVGNGNLRGAVMTGVFDIKFVNANGDGLTDDVTRAYSLQDERFGEFYGFTEKEVADLIRSTALSAKEKRSVAANEADIDSVREWYGYNISGRVTYNPRSIRHFVANEGDYRVYFWKNDNYSLVDYLLSSDAMQETLQRLDNRRLVTRPISRWIEFDNLAKWSYSYLAFSGCFNFSAYGFGIRQIAIPNREMETVLRQKMIDWLSAKLNVGQADFQRMYEQLAAFKVDRFRRTLEKFLSVETISVQCCNSLMRCLTHAFETDYLTDVITSPELSNVTLVSKPDSRRNNAVLIDYKIIKKPKKMESEVRLALEDMLQARRDARIIERYSHVKTVLQIALVFCRKELGLDYRIDDHLLNEITRRKKKTKLYEEDEE